MIEISVGVLLLGFSATLTLGFIVGSRKEGKKYWKLFRRHLETVKSYENLIAHLKG